MCPCRFFSRRSGGELSGGEVSGAAFFSRRGLTGRELPVGGNCPLGGIVRGGTVWGGVYGSPQ